jgi:hypothetical protein
MDVLVDNANNKEGSVVSHLYENMKIEGDFTNVIHSSLRRTQRYQSTPDDQMESSKNDVVISRDGTSVRFGDYEHVTSKGRVLISRGTLAKFDKDIGEGLGLHYDTEANGALVVYTDKDDPAVSSHGVLVMAPNFILAQEKEDPEELPMNRTGYIKIEPDVNGSIRNIHVKGSMIVDHYIRLNKCTSVYPGGWFFGKHSGEWFQPPKEMVIPEKQPDLAIVERADLVISRGDASVVLRSGGGVVASGTVAVFLMPVSYRPSGDRHDIHTKIVVVFQ